MSKLVFQILAGILGLWLATLFVPGVEFRGPWQGLVLAGVSLGLIHFFIKPILNFFTLPLRILTLGLFALILNMAILWLIDILFPQLIILGILPLFWTTLIVLALNWVFGLYKPVKGLVE